MTPVADPIPELSGLVQGRGDLGVGTTATFDIGAGTASFSIISQEIDSSAPDSVSVGSTSVPNTVVPTDVRDPSATLFYDDLAPYPAITLGGVRYPEVSGLLAFNPGFQGVMGAFPIPNTSAALDRMLSAGQLSPGTWSFNVNDWAFRCPFMGCAGGNSSGDYRVHVVTRPGPPTSTGTLDLEVYLATDDSSGMKSELPDAAAAVANPQTARWVQSIAHFLANAGLCLGTVTFHDVPDWARGRFAANGTLSLANLGSGPCSDLNQLFTTAVVPRRAVHLFIVDDLVEETDTTPTSIVGVDGSIPGPSGFPGTVYGGAVVGLFGEFGFESTNGACSGSGGPDLENCGTDVVAYVAAHEIGHWLGLFHTTEMHGNFFDPISDTDRCPCSLCGMSCGTSTAVVTNKKCAVSTTCGGGRNLMFWLLDPAVSTGELSRDQGQIARLNPAVR